MNHLQNKPRNTSFPEAEAPAPSLPIHPSPVSTGMPSLKSIFPTGKTLEEGIGAQGLGEGWQTCCVTKCWSSVPLP